MSLRPSPTSTTGLMAGFVIAAQVLLPAQAVGQANEDLWWTQPCSTFGRAPFGTLADVVDHNAATVSDLRFEKVYVHRNVPDPVTGVSQPDSTPSRPGLALCEGDLVETWHGLDARIRVQGSTAELLLEGGSLLRTDQPARQLRGATTFFLFDDRPPDQAWDMVELGRQGVFACRAGSTFRIEIIDEDLGIAAIAVSDQNDAFNTMAAPGEHSVGICDCEGRQKNEVQGGTVATVVGYEVSNMQTERAAAIIEDLNQRKAMVDETVRKALTEPPPVASYHRAERIAYRVVLQGTDWPTALRMDGDLLPSPHWTPRSQRRLGDSLVSVKPIILVPGRHQIEVFTEGVAPSLTTFQVSADPTTEPEPRRRPSEIQVLREDAPGSRGFPLLRVLRSRYRYDDGWTLGTEFGWGWYKVADARAPGSIYIPHMALTPRRLFQGGRWWLGSTLVTTPPSAPSQFLPLEQLGVAVGLAGGGLLSWELELSPVGGLTHMFRTFAYDGQGLVPVYDDPLAWVAGMAAGSLLWGNRLQVGVTGQALMGASLQKTDPQDTDTYAVSAKDLGLMVRFNATKQKPVLRLRWGSIGIDPKESVGPTTDMDELFYKWLLIQGGGQWYF